MGRKADELKGPTNSTSRGDDKSERKSSTASSKDSPKRLSSSSLSTYGSAVPLSALSESSGPSSKYDEDSTQSEDSDQDSTDETGDAAEIKRILERIGMNEYATAIIQTYPTLKHCEKLWHTDLRRVGILLYDHREKVLRAFREYSQGQNTKRATRRSSQASSSSAGSCSDTEAFEGASEIKRRLRGIGMDRYANAIVKKYPNLKSCEALSHQDLYNVGVLEYSHRLKILETLCSGSLVSAVDKPPTRRLRASLSSKSSSSSSSVGNVSNDATKIKHILKGLNEDSIADDFLEVYPTLESCRKMTHRDLREIGIYKFARRSKLIATFRNYKEESKKETSAKRFSWGTLSDSGSEISVSLKLLMRKSSLKRLMNFLLSSSRRGSDVDSVSSDSTKSKTV
eukprot:CAMPEP_0184546902 /NCGR_PEP_ID=MMETSP0199_2-20130426/5242_1 /TAXON_ID=1112570 /ORGANISM="Thraustochytrium sp., Strain LLF1b" /LENGTH=397 /DNA_ID=CAMNT_0026941343 /DNA_START=72 /DNA_END=1265 /DNA_ORIENTATION=+